MTDHPRLNDEDRERFAEIVESSFGVASRYKFFVWTQSSLQSLLPHEILLCGVEDGSRQGMSLHRFSASRYFRDEHFDQVADPLTGLLPRLSAVAEGQRSEVVMCPEVREPGTDAALHQLVADNELRNLAASLVSGAGGRFDAFYGFGRVSVPLDKRLAYLLALLVPHVHNAFLRVLATEREVVGQGAQRSGRLVTPRQEQILNLIKAGKTNSEIADQLDCSPFTIKNHIQAILRRLDSTSRAHAITRAMSLGILRPD